jgi:hypothetical protein
MEASSAKKSEYGDKEGWVKYRELWTAEFHHVTARSLLAGVLKLMNRLFLFNFHFFFRAAVIRRYGGTTVFCYIIVHNILGTVGIWEAQMSAMAKYEYVSETLTCRISLASAALT